MIYPEKVQLFTSALIFLSVLPLLSNLTAEERPTLISQNDAVIAGEGFSQAGHYLFVDHSLAEIAREVDVPPIQEICQVLDDGTLYTITQAQGFDRLYRISEVKDVEKIFEAPSNPRHSPSLSCLDIRVNESRSGAFYHPSTELLGDSLLAVEEGGVATPILQASFNETIFGFGVDQDGTIAAVVGSRTTAYENRFWLSRGQDKAQWLELPRKLRKAKDIWLRAYRRDFGALLSTDKGSMLWNPDTQNTIDITAPRALRTIATHLNNRGEVAGEIWYGREEQNRIGLFIFAEGNLYEVKDLLGADSKIDAFQLHIAGYNNDGTLFAVTEGGLGSLIAIKRPEKSAPR